MAANVKYADVNVGDALVPGEYRVVRGDLVVYAGASGDFNPIHWDPGFAKMVGLPTTIATGMHTMARIGKFVTDWAGDPGAVVKLGNRFTQPVPVPDEGQNVALKGTITEKLDDNTVKVSLEAFVGETNVSQAEALVKLA